ncbi:MAG: hypothetical protein L0099_08880 [Acidobacteria bacterium]|nr:hypothetical protein [Acidobacteriota bacterium]
MDEPLSSTAMTSPPEDKTPWVAIIVGGLFLLLGIAALIFITRPDESSRKGEAAALGPHVYAEKLQFAELKMTKVENFVGGHVTHLEGKLTNSGDRTVAGISVEVLFRNSLGEVAQKETLGVKVHQQVGTYTDVADLKAAPLKPGESRGFRLTFEHISADWNRAYPQLTVVRVAFQ